MNKGFRNGDQRNWILNTGILMTKLLAMQTMCMGKGEQEKPRQIR